MLESIILRIFVIIYLAIAAIVSVLLWRNSAAPDALRNAAILIATILPVVITVIPYFKQESVEKDFTFVFFYDSHEKTLIGGDSFGDYESNYLYMFTNLPADSLKAENLDDAYEKVLNIIEKGILQALLVKFNSHWDIEIKKFKGPVGKSESWGGNSNVNKKKITANEIQEAFSHNPLVTTIVPVDMFVPPDMVIKFEKNNKFRTIVFENSYVTLKIPIHHYAAMVAQHGVWGVLKPDKNNMNRYYLVEFRASAILYPNKSKLYSPEMKYYKKWFKNICDILDQYDWNTVDQQIENSLNRKVISKILKLNK